mmetsp:Transcript_7540/g.13990  ORF Transcript_7540/g.13990 Transcript_7540/m.13990 type:complete len:229 (-) Transcript_7540:425-1111(-)
MQLISNLGDNHYCPRLFVGHRYLKPRLVQVWIEGLACRIEALYPVLRKHLKHLLFCHFYSLMKGFEDRETFGFLPTAKVLCVDRSQSPLQVVGDIEEVLHETLDRELRRVLHLPGRPLPQVLHVSKRPDQFVLVVGILSSHLRNRGLKRLTLGLEFTDIYILIATDFCIRATLVCFFSTRAFLFGSTAFATPSCFNFSGFLLFFAPLVALCSSFSGKVEEKSSRRRRR